MGIFSKGRSDAYSSITIPEKPEVRDASLQIPDRDAVAKPAPIEVTESDQARQIVDQFAVEIGDSLSNQQSAMKRVNQLTSILSKMELDLKALRRVQSENRRLTKNVAELDAKLTQKSSWASELDSKLNDLERRHAETRTQLEETQAQLAAARDQEQTFQAKGAEYESTIRALTANFRSAEDQVNHNENTIEKMQDRLDSMTTELARREREVIELKNGLEELNEKYLLKAAHSDTSSVELKNLRLDYSALKSKYVELNGQLENVRYDLQTQKSVYEDTIKRRDEENMALKTRIDQLDTQVRVKESMATHLDQEFISLRNALGAERDRAENLDMRLRQKNEEYDRTARSLTQAKLEFDELNEKFTRTLDDYEMLRKINQAQREKLERYASIGGISGENMVRNADIYSTDKAIHVSENVELLKKRTS